MSIFTSDVSVDNVVTVDGSGTTWPVSAVALPLPAGASTEATLAAIKAKTDNLDVLLSTRTKPSDVQQVSVSNFPVTQPVSGTVSVSNFPATQPVSGAVSVSGTVNVITAQSSSSTIAQIVSTASAQTLLAANVNRKSAILFFTSGIWSVKYGAGASSTSFTFQVSSANTTLTVTGWSGDITAICTTSGKLVNVTELI